MCIDNRILNLMCFDGPIFVFPLTKSHVFWWTQKPHVFWWTLPLLKPYVFWWTQKTHVSPFFPLLKPHVFWWTQNLMSFNGPFMIIWVHQTTPLWQIPWNPFALTSVTSTSFLNMSLIGISLLCNKYWRNFFVGTMNWPVRTYYINVIDL